MTTQKYLSVTEAAEYLNVGERYIRRLVFERRVEFAKIGHHIRITREALDALVTVVPPVQQ